MMHKLMITGVPIIFGIFTLGIIQGCSADDPIEYGEINLVATVPENGGIISTTGELRLFFDSPPHSVTVNGKAARIEGNTATVKIRKFPNLIPGTDRTLSVEWRNPGESVAGTKTISFTVVKPATEVVVDPLGGTVQQGGAKFTLRFDAEIMAAWVNDTPAKGSGRNWTVWPILPYGPVVLNIKWINRDGSAGAMEVGPYEVADISFAPPSLTTGTVTDGDIDVDPVPINADGFQFDFDEDVTGAIKLTDEAGNDLNWIGNVAGTTAKLTPVAGQELAHNTIYRIEIDVADGRGEKYVQLITFVTKPK